MLPVNSCLASFTHSCKLSYFETVGLHVHHDLSMVLCTALSTFLIVNNFLVLFNHNQQHSWNTLKMADGNWNWFRKQVFFYTSLHVWLFIVFFALVSSCKLCYLSMCFSCTVYKRYCVQCQCLYIYVFVPLMFNTIKSLEILLSGEISKAIKDLYFF